MKKATKAPSVFRIFVGIFMMLLGVFSLVVGFYLRFVLQWKHAGAFSLVNMLVGILIVLKGAQYLRD
jgi:hypothetical protein